MDNYTYFNGLAECVHVVIYVKVPVVLSFPWDTVFTIIQGAGRDSLLVQWLGLCASKEAQPGFDPWSGNEDPASHMLQTKKKKKMWKVDGEYSYADKLEAFKKFFLIREEKKCQLWINILIHSITKKTI